jgi:hypothetical protein
VTSFKTIRNWRINSGLTRTHGTSITSQDNTIALTVCSMQHSEGKKQELFNVPQPVVFQHNSYIITVVLKLATCCNIINTSPSS